MIGNWSYLISACNKEPILVGTNDGNMCHAIRSSVVKINSILTLLDVLYVLGLN